MHYICMYTYTYIYVHVPFASAHTAVCTIFWTSIPIVCIHNTGTGTGTGTGRGRGNMTGNIAENVAISTRIISRMHESCDRCVSHVPYVQVIVTQVHCSQRCSCHQHTVTYAWVKSHICMGHVTYAWAMPHMHRICRTKKSCHMCRVSHVTCVEWVMSHV